MIEIMINSEGVRVLKTTQNIFTKKLKVKEDNIRWQEIQDVLCDDVQLVLEYKIDGKPGTVYITNDLFAAKDALMNLIRYRIMDKTKANRFKIAVMDEDNKYSISIFKANDEIGHDLKGKELTLETVDELQKQLEELYD